MNTKTTVDATKCSKCILEGNTGVCDNAGTIAHQHDNGAWEPQQCEWCYYREKAVSVFPPKQ